MASGIGTTPGTAASSATGGVQAGSTRARGVRYFIAASGLSMDASLRHRFLLFATFMVVLVVLQGALSWGVAERGRGMSTAMEASVAALMADLELLRTIKDMQVHALTAQNKVATAASDDLANVRIDLGKVAKDYLAAHAILAKIAVDRQMTSLGGIEDVEQRIKVAKDSFKDLQVRTGKAIDAAGQRGGAVPPDPCWKSARASTGCSNTLTAWRKA